MSANSNSASSHPPNDFRISPGHWASEWLALSPLLDDAHQLSPTWGSAVDIIRDRIESRFLRPLELLRYEESAGFLIVSVCCLLLETLQGLREGKHATRSLSRKFFKRFLTQRIRFEPFFSAKLAEAFYDDVRVGLLHDGETRRGWLIRIGEGRMVHKDPETRFVVLDRWQFQDAIAAEFTDYLAILGRAEGETLRTALRRFLDALCRAGQPDWDRSLSGTDPSDIARLAGLLRARDKIDADIAAVVGRPALIGHLGEFIARRVFGIELAKSATQPGFDGHFKSGPLTGRTVNVKWYSRQEGILDLQASGWPDFYLVFAGPKGSTNRGPRPWVIDSVYLFEADPLLRSLTVSVGVATSVRSDVWNAAEIYPHQTNQLLVASEEQRRLLRLFGSPGKTPI